MRNVGIDPGIGFRPTKGQAITYTIDIRVSGGVYAPAGPSRLTVSCHVPPSFHHYLSL